MDKKSQNRTNEDLKKETLHALFVFRNLNHNRYKQWKLDINMPACALLMKLQMREAEGETGGTWLSEMREYLCVSKAAVSQMLNSLEKHGLVTRETDPKNRRVVIVKLTEAGREKVKEYERIFNDYIGVLVERFGEKDTQEIIRLIYKFAEITEEDQ